MPSAEKSIVVNAPPERIWALTQDPTNWHSWFEGAAQPKSRETVVSEPLWRPV